MITEKINENSQRNKSDILIGIYIFCIVAAELMGSKSFPIAKIGTFNLSGAMGMFLIPWIYSINDIFTEVYGHERTKNLAKLSVLIVFLIVIFSALAIALPPSARFLPMEESYHKIFFQSIRISVASLMAMAISNFLDIAIFVKLKRKMGKSKLWLRNNLSNIMALFMDTMVFMSLAFYSINTSVAANINFLWGIILPYWLLKTAMSAIGTPLVYAGVRWLKN
ncbi:MAG: queuosine precursor transporter [Candidatus Shapirobacteria bacterium]